MIESRNIVNPHRTEYVVVGPLNRIVYHTEVLEDAEEMAKMYTRAKHSVFTVVITKPIAQYTELIPKPIFTE